MGVLCLWKGHNLCSPSYIFIIIYYYTAVLNAVECPIHLNGASQHSAPSAIDLVSDASIIPSLHSTQSRLFPPRTHVRMTLRSRGRISEKGGVFRHKLLFCSFRKKKSATDQEKHGLKSMAHYSDAILRAQAWSVRTAGEARVFFLRNYVLFSFIVFIVAVLHFVHVVHSCVTFRSCQCNKMFMRNLT